MSTHSEMQGGSPYEVDRDDEQPDKNDRDKPGSGEETGKKTRREIDPPIKREPNNPDGPAD
ncbi:MAG: hypothetical protein PsegKO_21650 [Pseudohongiellaceae bacterium]